MIWNAILHIQAPLENVTVFYFATFLVNLPWMLWVETSVQLSRIIGLDIIV